MSTARAKLHTWNSQAQSDTNEKSVATDLYYVQEGVTKEF